MIRNEYVTAKRTMDQRDWLTDSPVLELAGQLPHAAPAGLPLKNYLNTRGRLHHEAMYFPLGFPLRVLSNSADVLAAAKESWDWFHPVFHREPLEILLYVKPGTGTDGPLPPAPTFMQKGPLLLQAADFDNFFIADLNMGRALGKVTEAAAASPKYLRWHFIEAAALCMMSTLRAVAVHAACVRVGGKGILLCGDSGDGKSTLAFAGARSGWTYVTDDASYIPMDREDRLVLGNCSRVRFRPSCVEIFPELAGRELTPRSTGKPSIELSTSEWPDILTAKASFVDYIVFLNRKDVSAQELVPLESSVVWPWFKGHVLSTPETRPRQEAAFSRLLGAGTFQLRYRDLGWAIDRINLLATRGS